MVRRLLLAPSASPVVAVAFLFSLERETAYMYVYALRSVKCSPGGCRRDTFQDSFVECEGSKAGFGTSAACQSATFINSLVECIGPGSCEGATFIQSSVSCWGGIEGSACRRSTFVDSKVKCHKSSDCGSPRSVDSCTCCGSSDGGDAGCSAVTRNRCEKKTFTEVGGTKACRKNNPKPTPQPRRPPTPRPTPRPRRPPTPRPTRRPTRRPTLRPTRRPTRRPTGRPTRRPTRRPTPEPSPRPTKSPTAPPCFKTEIFVEILTDDYPGETSWTIKKNSNGATVASGGKYSQNQKRTTQSTRLCLSDGVYTFVINDTGKDGLCCGYGQGSYRVKDGGGLVLAKGGSFGSSESHTFAVGDVTLPTPAPPKPPPTKEPTTPRPSFFPTDKPSSKPTDAPSSLKDQDDTLQPLGNDDPDRPAALVATIVLASVFGSAFLILIVFVLIPKIWRKWHANGPGLDLTSLPVTAVAWPAPSAPPKEEMADY